MSDHEIGTLIVIASIIKCPIMRSGHLLLLPLLLFFFFFSSSHPCSSFSFHFSLGKLYIFGFVMTSASSENSLFWGQGQRSRSRPENVTFQHFFTKLWFIWRLLLLFQISFNQMIAWMKMQQSYCHFKVKVISMSQNRTSFSAIRAMLYEDNCRCLIDVFTNW